MKKLYVFILLGLLGACKKYTPPTQNSDEKILFCQFTGTLNGEEVHFKRTDVDYYGSASVIDSFSYMNYDTYHTYHFGMYSWHNSQAIEIRHGSLLDQFYNYSDYTVYDFYSFHQNDLHPAYTNNGFNGFEVKYTDSAGNVWRSVSGTFEPNSVEFSNVNTFQDNTGVYACFTCQFNCTLWNIDYSDSIVIQNGQLKGWFKM